MRPALRAPCGRRSFRRSPTDTVRPTVAPLSRLGGVRIGPRPLRLEIPGPRAAHTIALPSPTHRNASSVRFCFRFLGESRRGLGCRSFRTARTRRVRTPPLLFCGRTGRAWHICALESRPHTEKTPHRTRLYRTGRPLVPGGGSPARSAETPPTECTGAFVTP